MNFSGKRPGLNSTPGAQRQWCVVLRTWRACSEVARALCRLSVFRCRSRAALDPAPAPVLGMAAADAAPGGGLLCARAGGAASPSKKATPIEAKIVLRIVCFRLRPPPVTAQSRATALIHASPARRADAQAKATRPCIEPESRLAHG